MVNLSTTLTTPCEVITSIKETASSFLDDLIQKINTFVNFLFDFVIECFSISDCCYEDQKDDKGPSVTISGRSVVRREQGVSINRRKNRNPYIDGVSISTGVSYNMEVARSSCLGLTPPKQNAIKFGGVSSSIESNFVNASIDLLRKVLGNKQQAIAVGQFIDYLIHYLGHTQAHALYTKRRRLFSEFLKGNNIQKTIDELIAIAPSNQRESDDEKRNRILEELKISKTFSKPIDLSTPDSLVSTNQIYDKKLPHVKIIRLTVHLPFIEKSELQVITENHLLKESTSHFPIYSPKAWEKHEDDSHTLYLYFPDPHYNIEPSLTFVGINEPRGPYIFSFGLSTILEQVEKDFEQELNKFFEHHTKQLTTSDRKEITSDILTLADSLALDLRLITPRTNPCKTTPLVFEISADETALKFTLNVLLDVDHKKTGVFYKSDHFHHHFVETFAKVEERLQKHFYIPCPWKLEHSHKHKMMHGAIHMHLKHHVQDVYTIIRDERGVFLNGSERNISRMIEGLHIRSFSYQEVLETTTQLLNNMHARRGLSNKSIDQFWILARHIPKGSELALIDLRQEKEIRNENPAHYRQDIEEFKKLQELFSNISKTELKVFNILSTLDQPEYEADSGIDIERMICSLRIQ